MSTIDQVRHEELYTAVHDTVVNTIIDVIGQEFYEECEVGLDSTFAEDMELESMEMMEIAERLLETYEGKVDFIAWFGDMELEQIIELTLGDIINFIVSELEKPATGDAGASEPAEAVGD